MESRKAAAQLSSLANEIRLDILRLLVPTGRQGLSAGDIGRQVNLPASRLSFHLSALENTGILWSRRESRHVIYAVHYPSLRRLFSFLMNDCCGSHPKLGCADGQTWWGEGNRTSAEADTPHGPGHRHAGQVAG